MLVLTFFLFCCNYSMERVEGTQGKRINREKMNHWTKTRGTPKFKGRVEKEVADKGTDKT